MNQLQAIVKGVESSKHLTHLRVVCDDEPLHLLLAERCDLSEYLDHPVTLAFKESEVILLKEAASSTANLFHGTLTRIEKGEILTQVTLETLCQSITALVPTVTFDAMMMEIGDKICWILNPSEISLLRGHHGI